MKNVKQERSFEQQLASLELGAILAGEDGSFRFYHDRLTGEFVVVGHWSLISGDDDPPEALGPKYIYGRGKTIEEASEAIFRLYSRNFLLNSRIQLLCRSTAVRSALFSLWAKDKQDKKRVKRRIAFYHDEQIALWGYDAVFEELGRSKDKPKSEENASLKPIEQTNAPSLDTFNQDLTAKIQMLRDLRMPIAPPDVNLPPVPQSKET